ncbi:MAG: hypothetical protein V2J65_35865 [Desulfobacteraceae bacterium]|nr:hypothetical protein [Desulfobacteraceae bacterium]
MPARLLHVALIIGSLLVLITEAPSVLADVTTEIVRTRVEQLSFSGELNIGNEQIASVSVLPELYERCGFCLL